MGDTMWALAWLGVLLLLAVGLPASPGSLIQDGLVVTATHCLASLDEEQIKSLAVIAGEYNLFQKDKQEQRIAVQPICLPNRDNKFEEGILGMTTGWGKNSERGDKDQEEFGREEIKIITVPLSKLEHRRDNGLWNLSGITFWGAGCPRSWAPSRNNCVRTSAGIFSKAELMDFITHCPWGTVLFRENGKAHYPHSKEASLCIWKIMVPEDKTIVLKFTSFGIENQVGCDHDYVFLQSSNRVLIMFIPSNNHLLENNYVPGTTPGLDMERVKAVSTVTSLHLGEELKVRCGDTLPSPLLAESTEAIVAFASDANDGGSGFGLPFTAVQKSSEAGSGCGSAALLVKEGTIHSANYPDLHPKNLRCHWFIHTPEKHIIKLTFENFTTEFNQNRTCDAVVIYGDAEAEQELGVCGIPPFSAQWLSRRTAEGEEAPHCWLWQVGSRFLGNPQYGGAVISPNGIWTAARCVDKNNPLFWTIVAGEHDTLKESTEQNRKAKHPVAHENPDRLRADSDIAQMWLTWPPEFSSVVTVHLPPSTRPLLPSEICAVTGGSTSGDGSLASILQQIQVPVLEEREIHKHTYYSPHLGRIRERLICAGLAAGEGEGCQGDSGGSLVCRRKNDPFSLCGIVSWAAGCAGPRKPGVSARASVFSDWIQSKKKNLIFVGFAYIGPWCLWVLSAGRSSEVELEEPKGFCSTLRYPLDYRGKLCSWVLRVSPSSTARFMVEYLSLPGSHMCQDSVLTVYEEGHSARRMSGNPSNFGLELSSGEAALGLGELRGRSLYPMIFLSSGPLVRVTFHSVQGALGISYIIFRVQEIISDVLPSVPYRCHWRLLAPPNHIICLDIINFQMKPTALACQGHLWVMKDLDQSKN
ncbi:LOW QUALITY PROTEIN: ovochymase-1 [Glossophaga mutica]